MHNQFHNLHILSFQELPENAQKILYLHKNMSFLRFNYWKLQKFANKPRIYAIHENIGIVFFKNFSGGG